MSSSLGIDVLEDRPRDGQIGRYRLVGLLATGGMAQVYLALSGELSGFRTLVVVKRILPHLSSNTQFIHMFFDEARIAARLDHPNIARIIEVGQQGDEYFLAMEVVQGRSLSALLRKARKQTPNPLSHAQSAYIVAQAAKGLGYAHALTDADGQLLNIVHRDVSPQNILVSFGGAVKLIDFGVARALGRVTETVPGGLKGKIQYMSPEQVKGLPLDQRSDVYALGIVLWEALCGRRLYNRETDMETLGAIVHDPIAPPSKFVSTSARLERIVMQALAKDPAERFQTAAEMALALERHAFASDGFNPLQVSTAMKDLFAADYTRWNRTVAAAMDKEGPPETWKTTGTFLNPGSLNLRGRGPRLVPRAGMTPVTASDEPASDSKSETTAITSADHSQNSLTRSATSIAIVPIPVVQPAPRHLRPGAGIAIACAALAVALSVFAVLRPARTVTVIRAVPVPVPVSRRMTEAESVPTNRGVVPEAPTPVAAVETAPAPPPEKPETNPVAAPIDVPAPVASAPLPSSSPTTPAPPSKNHPAVHKRGARKGGHLRAAHDEPAPLAPEAAPVVVAAPEAAPATAGAPCSIRLGTIPWTEVWLDGRNTKAHTPYSEEIACGKHEVTFKRDDLGITKSISISLRDGEALKRSLTLGAAEE
ncbi:MAG TPA: protein kinase [Polyangia bacterium]